MEQFRILIADDHTLFREGVRALLGAVPDLQVVGEAATGEEAIAQAAALVPDVILMDIQMPGVNGIEATRRILRANPHIGIVVVTMLEDDDSVFAAMRAGARGYILKGADQAEMLRAIRAVAERFPEVCAAEEKFLRDVLGAAVERRTHIASGCNACEYSITFGARPPGFGGCVRAM